MRNYKRKNDKRKPLTENIIIQVRQLIETGLSVKEISRSIGYPESTIRRRIKAGCGSESLGRFKAIFTPDQEQEIVEHCIALDSRFYGLTLKSLRYLAFEFAEQNGIPHSFSLVTKLAGRDWARDFMSRNNLSLRIQRKTSIARTMGFNRQQLAQYFKNLQEALDQYKFPVHRIYNMDESSFQTVPNKLPKHVPPVDKREVTKNVSAEQGKTVTVACSMSAAGHYVPPFFIFARKHHDRLLLKDGPMGSAMAITDSGFMNTPTFVVYLQHFIKHTNPSADSPVLLLLDNHISHVSLPSITFAKDNNIHMLILPPHSSHRTQPLDRSFFRPLKVYYDDLCDNWTTSNPGQIVTEYHVAEIFNRAFEKIATTDKAIEGFRLTGIFPLDINIFTDEDFLPVTDQDQDVDTADIVNCGVVCFNQVPPIGLLPMDNPSSPFSEREQYGKRNMLVSGSLEPCPSSGCVQSSASLCDLGSGVDICDIHTPSCHGDGKQVKQEVEETQSDQVDVKKEWDSQIDVKKEWDSQIDVKKVWDSQIDVKKEWDSQIDDEDKKMDKCSDENTEMMSGWTDVKQEVDDSTCEHGPHIYIDTAEMPYGISDAGDMKMDNSHFTRADVNISGMEDVKQSGLHGSMKDSQHSCTQSRPCINHEIAGDSCSHCFSSTHDSVPDIQKCDIVSDSLLEIMCSLGEYVTTERVKLF